MENIERKPAYQREDLDDNMWNEVRSLRAVINSSTRLDYQPSDMIMMIKKNCKTAPRSLYASPTTQRLWKLETSRRTNGLRTINAIYTETLTNTQSLEDTTPFSSQLITPRRPRALVSQIPYYSNYVLYWYLYLISRFPIHIECNMPAWQCIYNYLDYVTDMRIVVNEKQVEKMQFYR